MAGESLKTGASAVAGTIVALAAAGVIIWNVTAPQRAQLMALLEGLNAKVDKTTTVIADMSKAPAAPAGPAPADAAIAALSAKLDATNKTLAALAAKIDATAVSLDEIKTAAGGSLQQISTSIGDLKASAFEQKTALTALSTATTNAAKDAAKATPKDAAQAPADRELVVVYVPQAAAAAAAAPRGLSVRFDRTAGTNATTQTQKLAGDLKSIIGDRKGCVISVAGYADTLGDDKVNLAVSRQRAEIVATGLRAALPGVEVKEVAWGERSLAVWTGDNKVEMANRRVDVNVECK